MDFLHQPNLITPVPAKYANIVSQPVVGPGQRLNLSPLPKERQWKLTFSRLTLQDRDAIKFHYDYHLGEYESFWWKNIPGYAGMPNLISQSAQQFSGTGWTAADSSTVSVTQGQSDPFGGASATRIQCTAGDATQLLKYRNYATVATTGYTSRLLMWVKSLSGLLRVQVYDFATEVTASVSDGWKLVEITGSPSGSTTGIRFRAETNASSIDCVAYQPNIAINALLSRWVSYSHTQLPPDRWKVECVFAEAA